MSIGVLALRYYWSLFFGQSKSISTWQDMREVSIFVAKFMCAKRDLINKC